MKKKPASLNLADMSFKQALTYAKATAGMTLEDIAERSGIKLSSIKQYFDEKRIDYFPSPHMIDPLCRAMENDILHEWHALRGGGCFVRNNESACDSPLELQVADLTKEFAEVLSADGQARLDNDYSRAEISKIEKELMDLRRSTNQLLKAIAQRKGRR